MKDNELRQRLDRRTKAPPSIWLTVYGDLITNLTLFFILLFYTALIMVQKGMGRDEVDFFVEKMVSGVQKPGHQSALRETMNELLQIKGLSGILVNEKEIRLILPEELLFVPDKAFLKEGSRDTLDRIGVILARTRFSISAEGHTCDIPQNAAASGGMKRWQLAMARSVGFGPFRSNWELSGARAIKVVDYLAFRKYVKPERMVVTACGPASPLVPNTSDENRLRNRRVELRIMTQE